MWTKGTSPSLYSASAEIESFLQDHEAIFVDIKCSYNSNQNDRSLVTPCMHAAPAPGAVMGFNE